MRVTARELATSRRRKPLPRRERDVQAAILTALRAMPGVVAFKTGAGSFRVDGRFVRMGHRGVSDLIGFRAPHGQVIAVEVKAKGKNLTAEQAAFLASVKFAGGIACVAYDVSDVMKALGK